MLPTFVMGPLQLDTYKVLYTVAFLVTIAIGGVRLRRYGYAGRHLVEGLSLATLGAVVGALAAYRIGRRIEHLFLPSDLGHTGLFDLSAGGGSGYIGALIGGATVTVLYCRWQGLPLGRTFDLAWIGLPLGQAIARLGCFSLGCCYGRPTEAWPGLYLPDAQGVWAVRFPAQIVAAAADLAIFVFLLCFEHYLSQKPGWPEGWPFPGFLFMLYLVLYAVKRFMLEFQRDTAVPLLGPLTLAHFSSLALLFVTLVLMLWKLRRTTLPADLPGATGS
jgi:phosphatidylglycerol:prolipoprotein diacylglycerol transferase